MNTQDNHKETRSRILFALLIIVVAVGLTYALVRLTIPSLGGKSEDGSREGSGRQNSQYENLPRGDAKRVADLDRLATALKTYKERHGGYPLSTGTCAEGRFDTDADLAFLSELERQAVIDAIPRDPAGSAQKAKGPRAAEAPTPTKSCGTMYGAKNYLYYSNGTKFALVASVDDADAVPKDAAGVHLSAGDREWFDGSALMKDWRWSRNVYIVSNQKLAEAAKASPATKPSPSANGRGVG